MRNFLLCLIGCLSAQTIYSQTTFTWKGTISTDWNTPGNWNPVGVPASTDHIIIATAPNTCTLSAPTDIANLTLTSGRLDMGGFLLRVNGTTVTFTTGTIQHGVLTITGANNTSFGTGAIIMDCKVNITSGNIAVRNTTFQDVTNIIKTGTNNDQGAGNNTFNGKLTATNTGTGYLMFGNGQPDIFNAAAVFNNLGSSNMYVGYSNSGNVYNGPVTFNNAPIAGVGIYVSSYCPNTLFNDNIEVTSTKGSGVSFCNGNSVARAALAATKTITIGAAGFSCGTLFIKQFIQTGATTQNITLTDSASLNVGQLNIFDGDVNFSAPSLYISTSTFNGAATITKTGSTNDYSYGSNIFNRTLTFNNTGSGFMVMGENAPDVFNDTTTFNNLGSSNLYVSHNNTGSTFNGVTFFNSAPTGNNVIYISSYALATTFNKNIILTSTSGQGISFCSSNDTLSSTIMSPGTTIKIGGAGFSAGTLLLRRFTQMGATAQTMVLTGTSKMIFANNSTFDGDVTVLSPSLFLNGTTFNGEVKFTKTGSSGDYSDGGNIFNGVCTITNNGSSYFLMGNKNPDIWNNDVTFLNNGTERILPCWASTGNQFNGNIYVNNIDSATGIQFCGGNSTATAILAAGKTIQPGAWGLTTGYLSLRQFTQLGNEPLNLVTSGATSALYFGPSSLFNGEMTATSANIYPQGAVYNAPVTFTKTGGTSNTNNQYQNIFNSTCTINQQSYTGYFLLGYNTNDQFNDDIIVTSTGTGGIYLGRTTGTGRPVLAAGKTVRVGPAGFSEGFLYFKSFTQLGTTPINLNFTGTTTYLAFSDSTEIGGNITSITPGIYFNGAFFKGKINATKTGVNNETSIGGNAFYDSLTITNAGTGHIILGNSLADTFYNAVNFNTSGTSLIGPAWNSPGNLFKGNITLTSTNSATGILFCNNTAANATLEAGRTLLIGPAGFSTGNLYFRRFTQAGNVPVNLPLTGTTTTLLFSNSSYFGGDVTATAPTLLMNGCTFNGTTDLTKTGATGDWGSGGNIFNGVSKFTNNGTSYLLLGNTNADIWNSDVTFTNNGTERILPAWASTGNQFNGDIYVNTTGSGQGIRFCSGNSTATATLAAGKTIKTGTDGLNAGNLQIKQFTQLGNAPVTLNMSSTGTHIQYGPMTTFGGDVTSTSPGVYFHGCTFNGTTNCTKTGSSSDYSNGGNIFVGTSIMTNAGSNYLVFANGSPDQFLSTVTFNNTGSSNIYVAHNSSGNVFNGIVTLNNMPTANSGMYISQNSPGTQFNNNIIVTSTNGQGIQFCNSATGSAILSTGNTISVGPGGFTAGTLGLRQFTQSGSTAQNLSLTGTGSLIFGPSSSFAGSVTSVSPALSFNGCIFYSPVNSTKTGTTNDQSQGNNIFNSSATITVTGTGYQALGNNYSDAYNGNVTLVQTGTGKLYPNFNTNCTYAGDIAVTSPSATAITFGSNTGTATLTGSGTQLIDATAGTPVPLFTRLVIANTGGGVTLNSTSINVTKTLTLTAGLLNTTTTNILTMQNGSTTTAGTALSTSYVNGPMRYQKSASGTTTLNFPIGNGADCRPVILTVNHTSGNQYTYQAQLFNADAAALGYAFPPSIDKVSSVHYYTINRMNSAAVNTPSLELSGNQTIQVFFGANDLVTNGSQLTIVKNANTALTSWFNIGGTGAPAYSGGANLTGSIISTSAPSTFNSFSTFALANISGGMNILPNELLYFTAKRNKTSVDVNWATTSEMNNSYFSVERSLDAVNFTTLQKVNTKALNGNSSITLTYSAVDYNPNGGVSYYRLKQTDINGNTKYSHIQTVNFEQSLTTAVYPNPTSGTLYISGIGTSEKSAIIEWYDVSGRFMARQTAQVQGGLARIETSLKDGIYIMKSTTALGKTIQIQNVIIRK